MMMSFPKTALWVPLAVASHTLALVYARIRRAWGGRPKTPSRLRPLRPLRGGDASTAILRPAAGGEAERLRAGADQSRLASCLEEAEALTMILPGDGAAQLDPARQRDIVDSRYHALVLGFTLFVAGKISEVGAGGEDHVDAGDGRDLFGVID